MEKPLASLRDRLDAIDQRIVTALAERVAISSEVARSKIEGSLPIRHVLREEDILTRIAGMARAAGVDALFATRVFQEILDYSVRVQNEFLTDASHPERLGDKAITVGYQGTEGAYSYLAAQRHFSARTLPTTFRGYDSFRAVLEAVRDGSVDYGILPLENTTAGSINDAYDLLAEMDLSLVGEEVQRVDHCLVGLDDQVQIADLTRVFSHPQALAQCTGFLATVDHIHVESFVDTAMAVKKVRADGDPKQAAIASEEAARLYGLHVLKRSIANQRENYTRMVVVAREPVRFDLRIPCKTSIVFALRHDTEEGALLPCLERLAKHHLNLTKLESRPKPRSPWEYLFYLDFEGNLESPEVAAALHDLSSVTGFLKVLGCYPARNTRGAKPARPRPLPASEPPPAVEGTTSSQPPTSSRRRRGADSVVRVGEALIGSDVPVVGVIVPTASTDDALRELAHKAKLSGAELAFGPRGSAATDAQVRVIEEQGLAFVHDVGRVQAAQAVARDARALRITGRHMEDGALLDAVGAVDCPVFLERASMASVEEWLAAAEVVLRRGNQHVVLIEAGVRSFAGAERRTLDVAALAALVDDCHLPILVDPSSAVSNGSSVRRLARAALAAGADGVVLNGSAKDVDADDLAGLAHAIKSN